MVQIQDRKNKRPAARSRKRSEVAASQLALADHWRGSEEAARVIDATLALGVDPATSSGAAAVTIAEKPELIGYKAFKDIEKKNVQPTERAAAILDLFGTHHRVIAAVEDMPARFFKNRSSAKIFTESRTRWSDAVRCLPNTACPPIDLHVQTWRALIDVAPLLRHYRLSARDAPDPKTEKRLLSRATKDAMREWLRRTFGLEIKDINVVEAIGIAYALAVGVFRRQLVLKGKGSASREAILIAQPRRGKSGDRVDPV